MTRKMRHESTTGYYHVLVQGINRELLFAEDPDKRAMLELLAEQQADKQLTLVGWCIMPNHAHIIVKAEHQALSRAMKIISVKFAARYNWRHKRTGPVFSDRFQSECSADEAHLLSVLRFVHLNPVRAKLSHSVEAYAWSSYGEYCGEAEHISAEQKAIVLSLLASRFTDFWEFHLQHDPAEYLETQEDTEQLRQEHAAQLLEDYCRAKGIARDPKMLSRKDHFTDVVVLLTQRAKLTQRQAALILETSSRRVCHALQGDK